MVNEANASPRLSSLIGATPDTLLDHVEMLRLDAGRRIDPDRQKELGQFMTPASAARMIASFADFDRESLRVLDPGAGVGSLTAALVARACSTDALPSKLSIVAYEVDPVLREHLISTLEACRQVGAQADVEIHTEVREEDFIRSGVDQIHMGPLFASEDAGFDLVIMNPPYRKIRRSSEERSLLSGVGIETSNLYTAFLGIAVKLLNESGHLVAITPRSFCNGPYFRPFRAMFLKQMEFRRIHTFHSRSDAFRDDEVLQENVIFQAQKVGASAGSDRRTVTISTSEGPEDLCPTEWEVAPEELVRPDDPQQFIRLVTDGVETQVVRRMDQFQSSLEDLDLEVSTGRVVDFRAKSHLRADPGPDTVPLIYPNHMENGFVAWPNPDHRKPDAIVFDGQSADLLVPSEPYVLVKRFSSKEERRRVTAAVFDPDRVPGELVGFENHLNYYHREGTGIPADLAKGLAAFLNSTLVDMFFRQFSGHTQVNATDLRSLQYPDPEALASLGTLIGDRFPNQEELDALIDAHLVDMSSDDLDPVRAKRKLNEAEQMLVDLGLPPAQQNERSALTLLSLLDLRPETEWSDAQPSMLGITPMMEFFREHYGKDYAPNTRETVRRQTVHQFEQAGVVVKNPDEPDRPTNSPATVYQVRPEILELARTYGTPEYEQQLRSYLATAHLLREQYARERQMKRVPVRFPDGQEVELSPGGQNVLVKKILEDFCPRFTPGARVIHVGDTADKWAVWDRERLEALGVVIEEHGKMPDVVVHMEDRDWLVLIEAVTSHGPVDAKRRRELEELFAGCQAGLVFVTAFLDRPALLRFLSEIAWETEVWVASAPTHLIHFNGERFLGPHE